MGISTGLPDQAYSFSGGWHKASKLILCAVMLRGRHRGLPVALDRAVRLPEEGGLGVREEVSVFFFIPFFSFPSFSSSFLFITSC